jgi:hypothetical protein
VKEQDMTEYMMIKVGDADRSWTPMSLKERKDGYAEHARCGEEPARRGHKVTGGAELHQGSEARSIRRAAVGDGIEVRRTVDASERPS